MLARDGGRPRRRVLAGLALAALVGALAGCGEEARLSPLAPDAVVLAFGDSLTYGTGAGEDETYPAVLERLSGRTVVNAGVPGEVSADGLERLPEALDEHRPAILILCHGGNDFLRKLDLAATERNLNAMIAEARGRGVEVVLVGVPQPGLLLSTHELYERVAEQAGVPLEAAIVPDLLGDKALKSDAVHPNAAGYGQLAEALHALLRARGAL